MNSAKLVTLSWFIFVLSTVADNQSLLFGSERMACGIPLIFTESSLFHGIELIYYSIISDFFQFFLGGSQNFGPKFWFITGLVSCGVYLPFI